MTTPRSSSGRSSLPRSLATAQLQPARIAWGVGSVDLSVNRRDVGPAGKIVHGWRRSGLLDRDVVSLQARRRDGSVIATLVGFGCHTVSVRHGRPALLVGFSGAPCGWRCRRRRAVSAVFFQGAAGNVNPMCAFCSDEAEARRMGERLAAGSDAFARRPSSLAAAPGQPGGCVTRAHDQLPLRGCPGRSADPLCGRGAPDVPAPAGAIPGGGSRARGGVRGSRPRRPRSAAPARPSTWESPTTPNGREAWSRTSRRATPRAAPRGRSTPSGSAMA